VEHPVILTNTTHIAQIVRRIPVVLLVFSWWSWVGAGGTGGWTRPVEFEGALRHPSDLSAVASVGERLAVASDEGAAVQFLEPTDRPDHYRVRPEPLPLLPVDDEIDIEAMAYADGTLWVLGSHSIKRRKIDPDEDEAANRARLLDVSPEPSRQRLFRVRVDPSTGTVVEPPRSFSLRPLLERDPLLGPFTRIPAVENGVNAEGLAVDGPWLYVGLRSPVLREGHVPVLRLARDDLDRYELLFVRLDGAGIRSLLRVADGFLLLARREHGEAATGLYFWNGLDQVTGDRRSPGRVERIGTVAAPPGGTPEGLALLSEDESSWELLVIHDGIAGGHPQRLRVPRPTGSQSAR
jgi:hypothetical protein